MAALVLAVDGPPALAPIDAGAADEPTVADYDDEPEQDPLPAHGPAKVDEQRRLRLSFEPRAIAAVWSSSDRSDADTVRRDLVAAMPRFALDFGGRVTDRAVVGAELAVGFASGSQPGEARTWSGGGALVSYVQWMFRPERIARPYVELRAGIGGSAWTRASGPGAGTRAALYPIAGGGFGAHVHLRERVAMVLGSELEYAAPFVRSHGRTWQRHESVVVFALVLGMALWF